MGKISSPVTCIAVLVALLLSVIGVGLPIDSAHADGNCATAPGAAAPTGQHWYYRVDPVKHSRCWYVHATGRLSHHAAAEHHAASSEAAPSIAAPQSSSGATPQTLDAASEPQPAEGGSNPRSEAGSTQPAAHLAVLTVKSIPVPFVGTASASQAATPEQTGQPPKPQISPSNADVLVEGDAKSASRPDPAPVPRARAAVLNAFAPGVAAATASARMPSAHLFLLLALAFGIATAVVALVSKMLNQARPPRLSDHPDDCWRRYRIAHQRVDEAVPPEEDAPCLAPQDPHGPAELDVQEWNGQSPPAEAGLPAARHQHGTPRHLMPVGLSLKEIELALCNVRQARQNIPQA